MRTPLNIDDFESFLEEEVNQHRMYPSDYVWRNIQQDLHGYKKWPALTVITLFVISALVAGTLLLKPRPQPVASAAGIVTKAITGNIEKTAEPKENLQQHLSPEHITQQTIAAVTANIDIDGAIQGAFAAYHGVAELPAAASMADNAASVINNADATTSAVELNSTGEGKPIAKKANIGASPVAFGDGGASAGAKKADGHWAINGIGANWMMVAPFDTLAPNMFYYTKGKWKTVYGRILYSSAKNLHAYSSATGFAGISFARNFAKQTGSNNFKQQSKINRFDVQVYVTPSLSYRTLFYNGSKSNAYLSGIPYNATYSVTNNQAVNNKPAMGYEAGFAVGYKLNNSLTLRTGLQFNVREYDIEGSSPSLANTPNSNGSNNTSTPPGNSDNGISGALDISAQTAQGGKMLPAFVLTNRYYQLALPVGMDWKAWGSGKFSLGLAVAMQPTYVFKRDPFMVTADGKSFTDGAQLMRRWNVNANLESYFAYATGKFKFQIGPQFRYQLLSTLRGDYPVKEHLLDYGVKIGVTRSLP